jgi:agmatinase
MVVVIWCAIPRSAGTTRYLFGIILKLLAMQRYHSPRDVIFHVAITLAAAACGHQQPFPGSDSSPSEETVTWLSKYGKQFDQPFSGPLAFSHAEYARCLEDESAAFDIAILGMPFDTGTSYRPGARFGPYAIRSGSRRQRASRGYTLAWGNNPHALGVKILDCGDVCLQTLVMMLPANSESRSLSYLLTTPSQ